MFSAATLLLCSAFLHASWNAVAKKNQHPSSAVWGIFFFAALFTLGFVPCFPGPLFTGKTSLAWANIAGLCEAGATISLAATLARSPLGASYTVMRGGAMLMVWSVSSLFLQEAVNLGVATGIALVLAGLYFVSVKGRGGLRVTPWAYLCAFFIAAYHLSYSQALNAGANPAALFALAAWIAVLILLIAYRKTCRYEVWPRFCATPASFILGGFLMSASFVLFLMGLKQVGAGFAFTLRNSSVVFAQFFALLLGEKIGRRQWLGVVCLLVGAACVDSVGG